MKITSSTLIAADRFMDRFGLTFINNAVNFIIKKCLEIYRKRNGNESLNKDSLKHYWSYIDTKDQTTKLLGLLPVPGLGNFCIWANNKRVEKLAQEFVTSSQRIETPDTLIAKLSSYSKRDQSALRGNATFARFMIARNPDYIRYISLDLLYNSNFMINLVKEHREVLETPTFQALDKDFKQFCCDAINRDDTSEAQKELNLIFPSSGTDTVTFKNGEKMTLNKLYELG